MRYIPDGVGGGLNASPFALASAYIDFGMRNLAHRPSSEDILRGGTAPNLSPFQNPKDGNKPFPLSYVELAKLKKVGKLPAEFPGDVADYIADLSTAPPVFGAPPRPPGTPGPPFLQVPVDDKSVAKGACKVPNLRMSSISGGYFHDGNYATLRQVVNAYTRGLNFPQTNFNEIALGIVPIPALDPSDPARSMPKS